MRAIVSFLPVAISWTWAAQFVNWTKSRKCTVLFYQRVDCGYRGITQEKCEQQNCCWSPAPASRQDAPWCFRAKEEDLLGSHYSAWSIEMTEHERRTTLIHRFPQRDPNAADTLEMTETYQKDIVNVKIVAKGAVEVPSFFYKSIPGYPMPSNVYCSPEESTLSVNLDAKEFQFSVSRKGETAPVLFDTAARNDMDPFNSIIYKSLYIEIGTRLSKNHYIYGLGERVGRFKRRPRRMAFNARDTPANAEQNSYGSHPFYLEVRPDGRAHGVLMLNAHPMEVDLGEDSLVYRMIGGTIDLYFFAGPDPDAVIAQYTQIVGRPPLYNPRFLGFHQCRYGYRTLDVWKGVVHDFETAGLPLEAIWLDIEYSINEYLVTKY